MPSSYASDANRMTLEMHFERTPGKLMQHAELLQRAGHLDDAARCVEVVLRSKPHSGDALRRLGLIRAQQGQLETAALLLKEGLACKDADAEGYNNFGLVLHGLNRTDEAIKAYESAVALRPNYVIALSNLGVAFAALERHDEAIAKYQAALALDPSNIETRCNMGAAYHTVGKHGEAIVQFEMVLASHPDFVEARLNLAHALFTLDRWQEAVGAYEQALEKQPDNGLTYIALAGALHKLNRTDQSLLHYKKALAILPSSDSAHAGLGNLYMELGRIDDAIRHLETALTIAPRSPGYFQTLSRTKKLSAEDPYLRQMLLLANTPDLLTQKEKIDLNFGLGQALSDAGQKQKAFEHLLVANRLKRQTISYNETAALKGMARTQTIFTTEFIRKREGRGASSSIPIFIVGMPRSGSTLVEQILSSHPKVFGGGELDTLNNVVRNIKTSTQTGFFPASALRWSPEEIKWIGTEYTRQVSVKAREALGQNCSSIERICDKMLANFRYVGLIHLALPNARIIHTRRDPIDTCLSCFSIQFAQLTYTNDLGELGRYYRAYSKLMDHWRSVLPPAAILDIQYEELVGNFEEQARRIVDCIGLEWDDRCLRFYETSRPVRTASLVQIRQPIYNSSVGRWRPDPEILEPLVCALEGSRGN